MSVLSKVQWYAESLVGGRQVSLHPRKHLAASVLCCCVRSCFASCGALRTVNDLWGMLYGNDPLLFEPVLVFLPSICSPWEIGLSPPL